MTSRTSGSRLAKVIKALAAFVALAAVIVGVPAILAAIGGIPKELPSAADLTRSLTARDDGTGQYFRVGAALAVWICWAIFTGATLKQAVATIRNRGPLPSLPRRGLHRIGPAALVALIAVMFVASPAIGAMTAPRAYADPAPTRQAITATAPAWTPAAVPAATSVRHAATPVTEAANVRGAAAPRQAMATYEVQRHDELWSIAERYLPGNPAERWKDIRALNPNGVGEDNKILPGTILTLPADARGLPTPAAAPAAPAPAAAAPAAQPAATHEHIVEKGDTFSERAAEHGIKNWQDAWSMNKGRLQPGGERFTNPHHWEPGWTFVMPGPEKSAASKPPIAAAARPAPAPAPETPPAPAPETPPAPARPAPPRPKPPPSSPDGQ